MAAVPSYFIISPFIVPLCIFDLTNSLGLAIFLGIIILLANLILLIYLVKKIKKDTSIDKIIDGQRAEKIEKYTSYGLNTKNCRELACNEASYEIDKLSIQEIEEIINISLDQIPLDKSVSQKSALYKRLIHVKDYILRKQGLEYESYLGTKVNTKHPYYDELKQFMDNNAHITFDNDTSK